MSSEKEFCLILCHKNRWRSPYIAALMSKHGIETKSAGVADFVEHTRAAKKMRDAAMERHGINLSEHRSKKCDLSLVKEASYIFVMDNGNAKRFSLQFPGVYFQVLGIKDPTFAGPYLSENFQNLLNEIDEKVMKLVKQLKGD